MINANRLSARVHDALTRDYNENHDEHGRFSSNDAADKSAEASEATQKTQGMGKAVTHANASNAANLAQKSNLSVSDHFDLEDSHLALAENHARTGLSLLQSHTHLDAFPEMYDDAANHLRAAAAHLDAAKAHDEAGVHLLT